MSQENAHASAKRRSLAEASWSSSAESRCHSAQQKHLACLERLDFSIDAANESTSEAITGFLSEAANYFCHKAASAEMKIKATTAYCNDGEKSPLIGAWPGHKDSVAWRATSIQCNPASSERARGLMKIRKKAQFRADVAESKEDPLRLDHLAAMLAAHVGIPPGSTQKGCSRLHHIKAWAIRAAGCSLLLRFKELASLSTKMAELPQEGLRAGHLRLPGGSKAQREGALCAMRDPRASPLCALGRRLRIREDKDGCHFCGLGGNNMLNLGKKARDVANREGARAMLGHAGVA